MSVQDRLLGAPAITGVDDSPPPRGRKSWALLARIVLSSRALGRDELGRLLFSQAADPAATLRWSLADLRRSLGRSDLLKGDPVTLRDVEGIEFDVRGVDAGDTPLADVDGELLAGMEPDDCPEFSTWLTVERHRLRARLEDTLRNAAHRRAGAGDWRGALELAGRAVRLNPLDEPLQELRVRCRAMSGDRRGAEAQVERCTQLFRDELGFEPSVSLRLAAGRRAQPGGAPPGAGRSAVNSLLQAGQAAVDAGAVDAGIDTLRRSLTDAKSIGEPALAARCALALGGALVHALRGRDEEGSTLLHEAVVLARRGDQSRVAAGALRELGYVDVQSGRRRQATRNLEEAEQLAAGDDQALASILGVRGMGLSDFGRYDDAIEVLQESVDRALSSKRPRQAAWSGALIGRVHVLRQEYDAAMEHVERALGLVAAERWTAFAPYPQALQAELAALGGRTPTDEIMESLQGTFALACQVADPCWEGMAARGMAVVSSRAGDHALAGRWIGEAQTRCNRVVDRYVWMQAYVMDGRCEVLLNEGRGDEAAQAAAEMAELSARTEQREHLVRALAYQGRGGDATALVQARAVAREVDNPALQRWLDD
jgi:DNA-binding SARP family transcriptional activator